MPPPLPTCPSSTALPDIRNRISLTISSTPHRSPQWPDPRPDRTLTRARGDFYWHKILSPSTATLWPLIDQLRACLVQAPQRRGKPMARRGATLGLGSGALADSKSTRKLLPPAATNTLQSPRGRPMQTPAEFCFPACFCVPWSVRVPALHARKLGHGWTAAGAQVARRAEEPGAPSLRPLRQSGGPRSQRQLRWRAAWPIAAAARSAAVAAAVLAVAPPVPAAAHQPPAGQRRGAPPSASGGRIGTGGTSASGGNHHSPSGGSASGRTTSASGGRSSTVAPASPVASAPAGPPAPVAPPAPTAAASAVHQHPQHRWQQRRRHH